MKLIVRVPADWLQLKPATGAGGGVTVIGAAMKLSKATLIGLLVVVLLE